MTYASVKNLPISARRLVEIKEELFESMKTYSVIRLVLRVVTLTEEPNRATTGDEFHKIGVSNITDKIWFVDGSFGEHYFAVGGIGTSYALGIAKTETEYLMGAISSLSKEPQNEIHYDEILSPESIYQAADTLIQRGFDPNMIFTNVKDHVELWRYPEYGGHGRKTHIAMPGHAPLIVDFAPEVPEGTSYVLDAGRFGTLVLKRDLDASVSEIADAEKPKLLAELPELGGQPLDEKVHLQVEEVLRIDIDEPRAAVVLTRRGSK